MDERTISFAKKAYDSVRQNPNLVQPYLDMTAFGMDFVNAHGFWTLHNMVLQLEKTKDAVVGFLNTDNDVITFKTRVDR
jgi:hypothetical protein